MQHAHAKEYEKVLKTVSHPLKEGHHFDQSLGGVAGMFDNIRSNTQVRRLDTMYILDSFSHQSGHFQLSRRDGQGNQGLCPTCA